MNNSDVVQICQTLKAQGKEPSIALIKSLADKRTPMPTLISGLQQWRANPEAQPIEQPSPEVDNQPSLEQRVKHLEHEVEYLKSIILTLS